MPVSKDPTLFPFPVGTKIARSNARRPVIVRSYVWTYDVDGTSTGPAMVVGQENSDDGTPYPIGDMVNYERFGDFTVWEEA